MQIRDYSSVTVTGRNPYPFINAVRESSIICIEQYCTGEVFHCKVRSADLAVLQEMADAFHLKVEFTKTRSLQRHFRRYRLRIGIAVGLLLAAGLIFWQSNVIETIEVQGNSTISDVTILNVLAREGVNRGKWIASVDMPHCEYTIKMQISGIAWCGIRHHGNHLIVEIAEETPQPPMLHERAPCNIIAAYDGQITGVRVHDGYLQRMIGDGVAKGDLIVSGTFEDAYGQTSFHHAIAEITGIYTKETELTAYYETETSVLTGRQFRKQWLRIFGLCIPLTIGSPPFSEMHQTETEIPFSFLSLRLPCSMVTRTYAERQTTITHLTQEEAKLALQADIVRYEKNLLSDVTILDRQIIFSESDDCLTCSVVYTVEGEIGMESEFMVK